MGLEASAKSTSDNLAKLGERLAVIDAAQAKISGLTQEVVSLKDILSNKQARGRYGNSHARKSRRKARRSARDAGPLDS